MAATFRFGPCPNRVSRQDAEDAKGAQEFWMEKWGYRRAKQKARFSAGLLVGVAGDGTHAERCTMTVSIHVTLPSRRLMK